MNIWERLFAAHERGLNRLFPDREQRPALDEQAEAERLASMYIDDYARLHPDNRPVGHDLADSGRHSDAEYGAEFDGVEEMEELDPLEAEIRRAAIREHHARVNRLEKLAAERPGELYYTDWLELADDRGVPLKAVDEYMALPDEMRPVDELGWTASPDIDIDAKVEDQWDTHWTADARPDPEAEAAAAALENHPKRKYGNQVAGFEHDGQQLYAIREHGDAFQILTPDEAEEAIDPHREHDHGRALLQAIEDDANYEADAAMPRPPANSHELGGGYYAEWDRAEEIAADRYRERVAELTSQQGIAYEDVQAEKDRQHHLAEQRWRERCAKKHREHEEQGIEFTPF